MDHSFTERNNFVQNSPKSGCFTACLGAHFPLVELDNTIWFSNVPGPFKGVSLPVAYFQIGMLVQFYSSIHVRDRNVIGPEVSKLLPSSIIFKIFSKNLTPR